MNVGELVTLSAAGKKNKMNQGARGLFGMVVEIHHSGVFGQHEHPYKIHWYGSTLPLTSGDEPQLLPMARYEIKKFRGKL